MLNKRKKILAVHHITILEQEKGPDTALEVSINPGSVHINSNSDQLAPDEITEDIHTNNEYKTLISYIGDQKQSYIICYTNSSK